MPSLSNLLKISQLLHILFTNLTKVGRIKMGLLIVPEKNSSIAIR